MMNTNTKKAICQIWSNNIYSLHLSSRHRMLFLTKRPKSSLKNLRESYECTIDEETYQKLLLAQGEHGLIFKGKIKQESENYLVDNKKLWLKALKKWGLS